MKRSSLMVLTSLLGVILACGGNRLPPRLPTPSPVAAATSVFDAGRPAYGFFPSPPEATVESVINHFEALNDHADFVLVQQTIPWDDFVNGVDGESQRRTDLLNLITLARQQNLDAVFVVDALNGLNRREFMGLPFGWQADFANPDVRTAFTNFALWIVREFQPRYLGLASEINTYADAYPADFANYLSLYREVYALVKAEAPETQIFVSFQWEDLNNLLPNATEGGTAYATHWDQVEAFEPQLDLWVISSYPSFPFSKGADIPPDYYAPLLTRTTKPLAVAEGGFTSTPIGSLSGTPQDQVDYLNAIHNQIDERLAFWVYLLLDDINPVTDDEALKFFTAVGLREVDGTPKPALAVWDRFRQDGP